MSKQMYKVRQTTLHCGYREKRDLSNEVSRDLSVNTNIFAPNPQKCTLGAFHGIENSVLEFDVNEI